MTKRCLVVALLWLGSTAHAADVGTWDGIYTAAIGESVRLEVGSGRRSGVDTRYYGIVGTHAFAGWELQCVRIRPVVEAGVIYHEADWEDYSDNDFGPVAGIGLRIELQRMYLEAGVRGAYTKVDLDREHDWDRLLGLRAGMGVRW